MLLQTENPDFSVTGIRHGKTPANVRGEKSDFTQDTVGGNAELNKEGMISIRKLGILLGFMAVDGLVAIPQTIYTSPYRRTTQSTEALVETINSIDPNIIKEITIEPRLREISRGNFEGKPVSEYLDWYWKIPEEKRALEQPPGDGGENNQDVANRAVDFVEERKEAGDTLVWMVTHDHVVRCLAGKLQGIESPTKWEEFKVKNASASKLNYQNGLWTPDSEIWNLTA